MATQKAHNLELIVIDIGQHQGGQQLQQRGDRPMCAVIEPVFETVRRFVVEGFVKGTEAKAVGCHSMGNHQDLYVSVSFIAKPKGVVIVMG